MRLKSYQVCILGIGVMLICSVISGMLYVLPPIIFMTIVLPFGGDKGKSWLLLSVGIIIYFLQIITEQSILPHTRGQSTTSIMVALMLFFALSVFWNYILIAVFSKVEHKKLTKTTLMWILLCSLFYTFFNSLLLIDNGQFGMSSRSYTMVVFCLIGSSWYGIMNQAFSSLKQ